MCAMYSKLTSRVIYVVAVIVVDFTDEVRVHMPLTHASNSTCVPVLSAGCIHFMFLYDCHCVRSTWNSFGHGNILKVKDFQNVLYVYAKIPIVL